MGIRLDVCVLECGAGPRLESAPFLDDARKLVLVDPVEEHLRTHELAYAKAKRTGEIVTHTCAITRGEAATVELCGVGGSSFIKGAPLPPASKRRLHRYKTMQRATRTVPAVTFDKVDPGDVDIMILDLEGSEFVAIQNMVSRPTMLMVEMFRPFKKRNQTIARTLQAMGYVAVRRFKANTIFRLKL
jgi:hypothetical protein